MTNEILLEKVSCLQGYINANICKLDNGYHGLYFDNKNGKIGYAYELNDKILTVYSLSGEDYQDVYDVREFKSHDNLLNYLSNRDTNDISKKSEKEVRLEMSKLTKVKVCDLHDGIIIWKGGELLGVTGGDSTMLVPYMDYYAKPINGNSLDYELIQ